VQFGKRSACASRRKPPKGGSGGAPEGTHGFAGFGVPDDSNSKMLRKRLAAEQQKQAVKRARPYAPPVAAEEVKPTVVEVLFPPPIAAEEVKPTVVEVLFPMPSDDELLDFSNLWEKATHWCEGYALRRGAANNFVPRVAKKCCLERLPFFSVLAVAFPTNTTTHQCALRTFIRFRLHSMQFAQRLGHLQKSMCGRWSLAPMRIWNPPSNPLTTKA
jgi:hypothetical protein